MFTFASFGGRIILIGFHSEKPHRQSRPRLPECSSHEMADQME
jgi:hypothetical protein